MKIWVVEGYFDYECSYILGAYSTEEVAKKRELDIQKGYDGTVVHELEVDEDVNV